jgi:hypothetical protein
LKPREFSAVLRYGKQKFCQRRRLRSIEVTQAFVLIGRNYDHRRLAVLGDGLRLASCRFDYLAEPVLGVLDRPISVGHSFLF